MVDPIVTPIVTSIVAVTSIFIIRGLIWIGAKTVDMYYKNKYSYLNVSLRDDNMGALALIRLLDNRFASNRVYKHYKATTINIRSNDSGKMERKTFYIPVGKWIKIVYADCTFNVYAHFENNNNKNVFTSFNVRCKLNILIRIMEKLKENDANLTKTDTDELFTRQPAVEMTAKIIKSV